MNRNAVTNQPNGQGFNYTNDWSTGICDCCADTKTCCFACLCFQCFMCCLFKEAGECMCTPVFCPGSLVALRSKMRAHYKIEGALWKDACVTGCLPCCAALQISNELRAHGDVQY